MNDDICIVLSSDEEMTPFEPKKIGPMPSTSNSSKVDDPKIDEEDPTCYYSLFDKYITVCKSIENGEMKEIALMKLLKAFNEAETSYKESKDFRNLINQQIENSKKIRSFGIYTSLVTVIKELRSFKICKVNEKYKHKSIVNVSDKNQAPSAKIVKKDDVIAKHIAKVAEKYKHKSVVNVSDKNQSPSSKIVKKDDLLKHIAKVDEKYKHKSTVNVSDKNQSSTSAIIVENEDAIIKHVPKVDEKFEDKSVVNVSVKNQSPIAKIVKKDDLIKRIAPTKIVDPNEEPSTSTNSNVDNSIINYEDSDCYYSLFDKYIRVCKNTENGDMMDKALRKILKAYNQAKTSYKESSEFRNLIIQQIENSKKPKLFGVYTSIVTVIKELKLFKFSKKKQIEKVPIFDETTLTRADYFKKLELQPQCNVDNDKSPTFQGPVKNNEENKDVNHREDDSDNDSLSDYDKETRKRIRKLEAFLEVLNKAINKLEIADTIWEKEEDSSYMKLDRYRKRFTQVYDKICQLRKKPNNAERLIKKKISFSESGYPEIDRYVQKMYNKTKQFPDFHDVLAIVKEVKKNDKFSPDDLHRIAEKVFKKFGDKLKKIRQKDDYEIMCSYISSNYDPANDDPELERKLRENYKCFVKKEAEVINQFVDEEREKGLVAEEVESSNESVEESEEEKEEEDENKLEKDNRLIEESDEEMEDQDNRMEVEENIVSEDGEEQKNEEEEGNLMEENVIAKESEDEGNSQSLILVENKNYKRKFTNEFDPLDEYNPEIINKRLKIDQKYPVENAKGNTLNSNRSMPSIKQGMEVVDVLQCFGNLDDSKHNSIIEDKLNECDSEKNKLDDSNSRINSLPLSSSNVFHQEKMVGNSCSKIDEQKDKENLSYIIEPSLKNEENYRERKRDVRGSDVIVTNSSQCDSLSLNPKMEKADNVTKKDYETDNDIEIVFSTIPPRNLKHERPIRRISNGSSEDSTAVDTDLLVLKIRDHITLSYSNGKTPEKVGPSSTSTPIKNKMNSSILQASKKNLLELLPKEEIEKTKRNINKQNIMQNKQNNKLNNCIDVITID